jgi:hypothetical protein
MNELFKWFSGDTWAFVDAVITLITVLGVLYGLYKNYQQSQNVELFFRLENGESKKIPISLTRKNVTRSEISGLLGMIQKDSKTRHNVHSMTKKEYFKDIYDIQNAKKSQLYIDVTPEELEQFII